MLVTLLGIVMEVKEEQPSKALSPILVTLLGIVMDLKDEQCLKVPLAIRRVPTLMLYAPDIDPFAFIKQLLIYNAQGISLDLSSNQNLEELEIKGYDNPRLNISGCNKLWYLDCGNSRMREILVSNVSALKEIIFREECPLTPRSLSYVKKTLERNNGTMTITTYQ